MFFSQQVAFLSILLTVVLSHSWVERVYVVSDKSTIGNPGFPRGNGKSQPD
jgi:hypothetical protein